MLDGYCFSLEVVSQGTTLSGVILHNHIWFADINPWSKCESFKLSKKGCLAHRKARPRIDVRISTASKHYLWFNKSLVFQAIKMNLHEE